ncbi:30S ribosomal protein S16 [bacterium]|jgi:small subunit ribosomal protein S16|nr:30S ribosomal protein S16 [bacterium]MBT3903540.1 30S ribosomal protein S16 [bacterium]MBT4577857.1 30S ribosomal protein S16 [bacterium]MBT5346136.1 30S ribosomal protein S16 [bacterium]MBT6131405.1 30S ribosomal protein S16 [bacterium]
MAVKIRLSRIGKKHRPFHRIVATDSRKARDGQALEILGTVDPLNNKVITFNQERVDYWLSHGAIMSDSVRKYARQFVGKE